MKTTSTMQRTNTRLTVDLFFAFEVEILSVSTAKTRDERSRTRLRSISIDSMQRLSCCFHFGASCPGVVEGAAARWATFFSICTNGTLHTVNHIQTALHGRRITRVAQSCL